MKRSLAAVLALVACIAVPLALAAKGGGPGKLDKSFSGDGRALVPGDLASGFRDLAVDKKGRTVGISTDTSSGDRDYLVARFTPRGKLDGSFSGNGLFELDGFGLDEIDEGFGVTVDNQGRVIGVGQSSDGTAFQFTVFRLTPSGALDQSFSDGDGSDGRYSVDVSANNLPDRATDVVIDSEKRIVVAGHSSLAGGNADFVAVRLLSDGTPDSSFNGNGIQGTSIPGQAVSNDRAHAVAIDSQGRIVLAGFRADNAAADDIALVRYLPGDGDEDPAFGTNGATSFDYAEGDDDYANGLTIGKGNRPIVAGFADINGGPNTVFGIARFKANGTPDDGFGDDARVSLGFPGTYAEASAIEQDKHGRLVVGGLVDLTNNAEFLEDFAVVRLTAAGKFDKSFGKQGKSLFDFGSNSDAELNSLALDPMSGRILAGGQVVTGANNFKGIARLEAEPRCFGKAPTITGTSGKDKLKGTNKADVIFGGDGKDELIGKGGNDRLCGGKGRDTLRGGPGVDLEDQ